MSWFVILATRMKPLLSRDTSSFDVFKTKFDAWCFEKRIANEDILKVLPACIDDSILQSVVHIFSVGTTTVKTALDALKEEYLRQARPADPDSEFYELRTALPSTAIDSCVRLMRLASYMDLGDTAVKHRLFKSLPISIQPSVVSWMDANPRATSKQLANFITTFPDSTVQQTPNCSVVVQEDDFVTAATSRPVCDNCRKPGHSRDKCFKLRRCWSCNGIGHLSRNCNKQKNG